MTRAIQETIAAFRDYLCGIGGDRPLLEHIRYRLARRDETGKQIIARILCDG